MNLFDLRTRFWRQMDDVAEPHLWPEDEVNDLANEAQMEAVRRGHLIIDSDTSAICSLAYTTDPVISLDSRVIAIRTAIVAGRTAPLERAKVAAMDTYYPGWRTHTAPHPTAYIDDWGSNKLRLYPAPAVAGSLRLTVAREPLADMWDDEDVPEIPARYHRALVHWMRAIAYSTPDTETFDAALAAKAEADFIREFGERRSARNEQWASMQAGGFADALC